MKHFYRYQWMTACLFFCLIWFLFRLDVSAVTIVERGYCGINQDVSYTLDSDGLLQYTVRPYPETGELAPTLPANTDQIREIFFDATQASVYITLTGKAFSYLPNLERVTIRHVYSMEASLFENCPSLTYFEAIDCMNIGKDLLKDCTNLETLVLCYGCYPVGGVAFPDTGKSLKHLILKGPVSGSKLSGALGTLEKLETLDAADWITWFVSFCDGLPEDDVIYQRISAGLAVTIDGKTVTEIHTNDIQTGEEIKDGWKDSPIRLKSNLFCGFPELKHLYLDENVFSLGKDSFKGVDQLETVHVPTLSFWLNMIFSGEGNDNPLMTSPNAVLVAEDTDFTEVEIPEGVYQIPAGTFRNQKNLTTIILPESIESIGADAFLGCDNLQNVYIKSQDAWERIRFENEGANPCCNEMASVKSYDEYQPVPGKLKGTDLVWDITEDGTLMLSGYANEALTFEQSPFLRIPVKKVVCANNAQISGIPAGMFAGCTGITEVELSSSVTSIGASAFAGCTGLTRVLYTEALNSIGASAFADCSSLHQFLNLDNSFLDEDGFTYEPDVVELSESMTMFGTGALDHCTSIRTVMDFGDHENLLEQVFTHCEEIDLQQSGKLEEEDTEDQFVGLTEKFDAVMSASSLVFTKKSSQTISLKKITNTGGKAVRITSVAYAQRGIVRCTVSGKSVKITPYNKKGSTSLLITASCGTATKTFMIHVTVKTSTQDLMNLQTIWAPELLTMKAGASASTVTVSGAKTSLVVLKDELLSVDGRLPGTDMDTSVAKVLVDEKNLVITPLKEGETDVYLYAIGTPAYEPSNIIRIHVTVTPTEAVKTTTTIKTTTTKKPKVKKITISGKKRVRYKRSITLTARVTVGKGGSKKLKWSISNKRYARLTVLKGGLKVRIKGRKAGRGRYVKITAKATDGSKKKATYRVKIKR